MMGRRQHEFSNSCVSFLAKGGVVLFSPVVLVFSMLFVVLLPVLWSASIMFKLFVFSPSMYFGIETMFLWAVEEGTPAFRFDSTWRKGHNRRDEKVVSLFHPGEESLWIAKPSDYLQSSEGIGDGEMEHPDGITHQSVAFLMTFSLLVDFTFQGLIGISTNVANNMGPAGWGYISADMCCAYTILGLAWDTIVFMYNSYIVGQLVAAAIRTGSKSLFVPGVLCIMPAIEIYEPKIELVAMEMSDLKEWKKTDLGTKVVVKGYNNSPATLVFVGINMAGKPRIGVEFEDQVGKHQGLIKEHPKLYPGATTQDEEAWQISQYFKCRRGHGMLMKPKKAYVQMPMSDAGTWKVTDIGSTVSVDGHPHKKATIAFVGLTAATTATASTNGLTTTTITPGDVRVGVVFEEKVGSMNGQVGHRVYFECKKSHGLLVNPALVTVYVSRGGKLWAKLYSRIDEFQPEPEPAPEPTVPPKPPSKWDALKGRMKEVNLLNQKGRKAGFAKQELQTGQRVMNRPTTKKIDVKNGLHNLAGHLRSSLRRASQDDPTAKGEKWNYMAGVHGQARRERGSGSDNRGKASQSAFVPGARERRRSSQADLLTSGRSAKKAAGGLVPYRDEFIYPKDTSRIQAQKILLDNTAEDGTFLIRHKFAKTPTFVVSLKVKKNFAGTEQDRFEHHAMSLESGKYKSSGQDMPVTCTTIHEVVEHLATYPNGISSTPLRRAIRANEAAALAKLGFAMGEPAAARPARKSYKDSMAANPVKKFKPELVKATTVRLPGEKRPSLEGFSALSPLAAIRASTSAVTGQRRLQPPPAGAVVYAAALGGDANDDETAGNAGLYTAPAQRANSRATPGILAKPWQRPVADSIYDNNDSYVAPEASTNTKPSVQLRTATFKLPANTAPHNLSTEEKRDSFGIPKNTATPTPETKGTADSFEDSENDDNFGFGDSDFSSDSD